MMKRILVCAALFALICASAGAVEKELVLFDFEGTDTASMRGVEVSAEQAKTGKASGKWANQTKTKGVSSSDIPHDWSQFDTLSFWLYSEVANDAEFMMIIYSQNEETEGPDYYATEIKVDWTGWRFFEYDLRLLGKNRKPLGWDQIGSFGFTASGWGNEPKDDTVIYIDDVRLQRYGSELRNASFEIDSDGDGAPDHWKFSPQSENPTAMASLVDGGHTGKCVKIVDEEKKIGVGVQQRVAVEAGKTYRLSAWKKGGAINYYLNFYGADGKRIDPEHSKHMRNKGPEQWEDLSYSATAPEGAQSMMVWIYSTTANVGTFYIDDAKIEEVK